MNTQLFPIDSTLGISVSRDKYFNEITALMQLKQGLILLYNNVKCVELQKYNLGKNTITFGNDPSLPPEFKANLPCFFHWFGTSLCNYARLVGFVVSQETGKITINDLQSNPERKKIKDACDVYMHGLSELTEVLKWRNKVAAHFALTDPRKDDNIATMEASIIYPVGYKDDRFRTATLDFVKFEGNTSQSAEIPSWSLTETFELLINRFWPEITIVTNNS